MSDFNESFWDGLGAEIEAARPEFQGFRKSSPRAEGTLRSFHITPLGINRGRRNGVSLLNSFCDDIVFEWEKPVARDIQRTDLGLARGSGQPESFREHLRRPFRRAGSY